MAQQNAEKQYRHEYKHEISFADLLTIRARMRAVAEPDLHTKSGRYLIRSLYFDDWENSCYYENENGTEPREKFRIRIYNHSWRNHSSNTHTLQCSLQYYLQ